MNGSPSSLVTRTRTIIGSFATSAVEHFLTINHVIRQRTVGIATGAHLWNGFDFFVLVIQTFAWDTLL